jgi:hypothetical protein
MDFLSAITPQVAVLGLGVLVMVVVTFVLVSIALREWSASSILQLGPRLGPFTQPHGYWLPWPRASAVERGSGHRISFLEQPSMMLKGLQALLHSCKHRYRRLDRVIRELKRCNKFTLTRNTLCFRNVPVSLF